MSFCLSLFLQFLQECKAPEVCNIVTSFLFPTSTSFFQKVPNKLELRGYAVTPLRVCYCINKYTQKVILFLTKCGLKYILSIITIIT